MDLEGIISAFGGLVNVGESVPITINKDGIQIEVDNLSNNALMNPDMSLKYGKCDQRPVRIESGYKEAMLARKRSYTPSGSFGVVSWEIGNTKNRVVIMWSMPFLSFVYNNWLAVGIKPSETHDPKWATEMYNDKHESWFDRAKYNTNVPPVAFITDEWAVTARMNKTHGAQVRVTFTPINESDVAQCLKDKRAQQK